MKKIFMIVLLTLFAVPQYSMCKNVKTITKERLMDKIKGAWAGQAIGCTYGGPTEFRYQERIMPDDKPIEWREHYLQWFFKNDPGNYDDLYMEITFLDKLHRYGLNVPVDTIAKAYAYADFPLWHANQEARYNILHGIMPPKSGYWKNNPHADDIDYQIEADYAGVISPGLVNAASRISDKIGHIMNYGDGWYGGVYVGAMYATAYVCEDVETMISTALQAIPAKSKFHQAMNDILTWFHQYPTDWKQTWQLCEDRYADEITCPDGVKDPFDIDALINSCYITIGLLYGGGDFERTIEIATRCGQDSDCNPASAGGILGCLLGYSKLPQKMLQCVQEVENEPFAYTNVSLNSAYQYSMDLALEQIKKTGGKIEGNEISINVQKVKPVRYEQSFEGMDLAEVRKGGALKDLGEIRFNGCAIVIPGEPSCRHSGYTAEIEVYLDGKLREVVTSEAQLHGRALEICKIYGLKQGSHTLKLNWRNAVDDATCIARRIIVYKKK